MKKISILFFLYQVLFFSVNATTYYVSSVNGNNLNNDGSKNNPWATLQYAANKTKPGDSVIVKSGNYAGFVMGWDGNQSGTPNHRITFKAESGAVITSKNNKTADGINLEGASYITIDGFTINNSGGTITRAGIRCVLDTGIIIRNNTIDGIGTWGILTGFSENILIENNICSHSGTQHGIYFSNSADHPVIRNNTCFSNAGCGIHMNADSVQGGDGIITDALVEGNIIYDNGVLGGAGINMDGVQNSKVINNLLYNNHAGGITVFQIDGKEPSKNNLFYHNTVIMAANGRWALNINSGSTGNTVYNNIFLSYHITRGGLTIDNSSLPGFKSDYNATINRFSSNNGNSIITLSSWQTQTGQDQHSFIANNTELFANTSINDYHLISGSKALNIGTTLVAANVNRDLENHSRPMGTGYDLGCYEFIEGVATHLLTVNNGTGDGAYTAGQTVSISSDAPPQGKVFDKWTGDISGITNIGAAHTTLIMPAADITITASYIDATGLENILQNNFYYPSPACSHVYINCTGVISLYDLSGIIIIQKTITDVPCRIDVSNLSPGLYILELRNADHTIVEKLIKE